MAILVFLFHYRSHFKIQNSKFKKSKNKQNIFKHYHCGAVILALIKKKRKIMN